MTGSDYGSTPLAWEDWGTNEYGPARCWKHQAEPDPHLSKQKGAGVKPTHCPAMPVIRTAPLNVEGVAAWL